MVHHYSYLPTGDIALAYALPGHVQPWMPLNVQSPLTSKSVYYIPRGTRVQYYRDYSCIVGIRDSSHHQMIRESGCCTTHS